MVIIEGMSDEKLEPQKQAEAEPKPAGANVSSASDNITMSMDQFQAIIRSTVDDVLKNSKLDEARKQAEEYNAKIAESVKNSQASIIKSNRANGQTSTDYIKRVLAEDNRRRFQSGEGKALYSDKGEDFVKAKIVLLHKMGLKEEEIAKELEDIL